VRRSRLLFLAAVAVVAVAAPIRPAEARKSACPHGSGCVWDGTDFDGQMTQVPSTGCIDARIRSAVNGSDHPVQFFMGAGCRGPRAGTLQPGQETSEINAGSATGACSDDPTDPCGTGVDPGSSQP